MNLSSLSFAVLVSFGVGLVGGFLANGYRLENKYLEEKNGILLATQERQKALIEENENLQSKLRSEKANAEKNIANLKRDLRTGRVQLSIPTTGCRNSSFEFGEERSIVDGSTAEDLISIASDGDQAIRELNYCIDAYNSLRKK